MTTGVGWSFLSFVSLAKRLQIITVFMNLCLVFFNNLSTLDEMTGGNVSSQTTLIEKLRNLLQIIGICI